MRKAILILCVTMLSITVSAQSKSENEVKKAVERLTKAMIDGDKAQLNALVAEKLSYGHSNGKVEDKATFVETIASGQTDYSMMNISEQTINFSGKTAIVRHKLLTKLKDGGKDLTLNLGVMLIWQRQHGKWKVLARQAFKI